jgi:hypothetical protein
MAKDIDRRLRKFEDALVNVLANVDDKLDSKLRKKLHRARKKLKNNSGFSKKKYRHAVLRAHEQGDGLVGEENTRGEKQ